MDAGRNLEVSRILLEYNRLLLETNSSRQFFDSFLPFLRSMLNEGQAKIVQEKLLLSRRCLGKKYSITAQSDGPERVQRKIQEHQVQVLLHLEVGLYFSPAPDPLAKSQISTIKQLLEPISYLLDINDVHGAGLARFLTEDVVPL